MVACSAAGACSCTACQASRTMEGPHARSGSYLHECQRGGRIVLALIGTESRIYTSAPRQCHSPDLWVCQTYGKKRARNLLEWPLRSLELQSRL